VAAGLLCITAIAGLVTVPSLRSIARMGQAASAPPVEEPVRPLEEVLEVP
jgi:hypothetical protein